MQSKVTNVNSKQGEPQRVPIVVSIVRRYKSMFLPYLAIRNPWLKVVISF